jgi:hypothetical protein
MTPHHTSLHTKGDKMPKMEIPSRRRIERKELISFFCAMHPGQEVTPEEIYIHVGLDIREPGGRSLCYQVREHCRDVIGFCIEYTLNGKLRRETDIGVVTGLLPKRRQRIHGQVKRGVAETLAIANFAALPRDAQANLLAYQSTLDTLALASQKASINEVSRMFAVNPKLSLVAPEEVIAAAQTIKQ